MKKKTTTIEQFTAALGRVKSLIAQVAQAAAQDIAALTAADVGAVPTSRKVNGKALSGDISLTASDVGARSSSWMPTAAQVGAASASHTHVSAVSVTIPTTSWGSDSTATYPKYYDIAVSGVTAKDVARVEIATAALGTAVACGLCSTCETLAGKIRLRAVNVPSAAMAANYEIEKGA